MEQFIQQVATGLATGSIYALLALAVVLIYRSTEVVNFAQGEMAMLTTFIAWTFLTSMNYWLAFFLAVLVALFIGAMLERVLLRPVEEGPVLNPIIVTLGLFTALNSIVLWRYGGDPKPFPKVPFFEGGPFSVGTVAISRANIGVFCVAVVIMVALYLFFTYTKVGLAMRATALNRGASRLVGIRVGQMLTLGWALSAGVGAVAGMLAAPIVFLSTNMMFGLILFAFAAAVLGGLTSPLGAILGGLTLGVVQNLAATYNPTESSVDLAIAFLIIVVVLVIRPTGLLGKRVVRRV
ncbi:MAG: branched-chain amino acid ABC transporter permease [Dehalococcoidia bacterium]